MLLAVAILALGVGFLVVGVLIPRLRSIRVPGLPGKETTLKYWGLWEPPEVMESLVREFNQEHPQIKVEYVQQSQTDAR